MKYIYLLVFALSLSILYGEAVDWEKNLPAKHNRKVRYGATQIGEESISSIIIHGPAVIDRVKILETMEVNGTLNASKSQVKHLIVNGNLSGFELSLSEVKINGIAQLSSSTVSGTITVFGSLNSHECIFKESIVLDSTETFFNKSNIQDITILNNSSNLITQKVYIKDHSKIIGKITFKSGIGEVIVSGNSTVTPSQVVGGKIINKD